MKTFTIVRYRTAYRVYWHDKVYNNVSFASVKRIHHHAKRWHDPCHTIITGVIADV